MKAVFFPTEYFSAGFMRRSLLANLYISFPCGCFPILVCRFIMNEPQWCINAFGLCFLPMAVLAGAMIRLFLLTSGELIQKKRYLEYLGGYAWSGLLILSMWIQIRLLYELFLGSITLGQSNIPNIFELLISMLIMVLCAFQTERTSSDGETKSKVARPLGLAFSLNLPGSTFLICCSTGAFNDSHSLCYAVFPALCLEYLISSVLLYSRNI